MPKLVVGCPASNRAWVFPKWIDHVLTACDHAGLDPEFVFVIPQADREMIEVVGGDLVGKAEVNLVLTDEDPSAAKRDWQDMERLRHMATIRNRLLRRVREIQPELFWSLDSDMLAGTHSLKNAAACLAEHEWTAVGMRTFMQPVSTMYASKANLVNGRLVSREDTPYGAHQVDVIMGAKLMTPPAYRTDYEFHEKGEDVGWSVAVARQGLRLGWCASACVKHVMHPKYLDRLDERVGF